MIRDLAYEEGGVLFTADKVQATVARAKGVENIFIKTYYINNISCLELVHVWVTLWIVISVRVDLDRS